MIKKPVEMIFGVEELIALKSTNSVNTIFLFVFAKFPISDKKQ